MKELQFYFKFLVNTSDMRGLEHRSAALGEIRGCSLFPFPGHASFPSEKILTTDFTDFADREEAPHEFIPFPSVPSVPSSPNKTHFDNGILLFCVG
jgi:hypothetical protein